MHMDEYKKVKNMTYLEYCDYLQKKYGIGLCDYMTKEWKKNRAVTRTKEGLIAHHKAEDKMIMLCDAYYAQMCPFEWQQKENIVYCDYLEHLLLHVLICIYPSKGKIPYWAVGFGGVVNFLVPELNDMYSGFQTKQAWRQKCYDIVLNDKNVYFEILKKFIDDYLGGYSCWSYNKKWIFTSFNAHYGLWDKSKNEGIFKEIDEYIYSSKRKKESNQEIAQINSDIHLKESENYLLFYTSEECSTSQKTNNLQSNSSNLVSTTLNNSRTLHGNSNVLEKNKTNYLSMIAMIICMLITLYFLCKFDILQKILSDLKQILTVNNFGHK